jgi:formylglycine-generating enzyme required for sulfatase activity
MRWLGNLALGLVFWCIAHADALAEKRVALVIGNGVYTHAPHLPNPANDADDVAAALMRIGFDVIKGTDLDQAGMQDAIIRFARAAQSADVGLFYYSGHAMQFNSVNYLMPVDARLNDEADLYRFTKVDDVLGYLQQAKALKILVLDSCRDNPLAETLKRSIGLTRAASLERGLARIEAPIGTIISYSTQAGRTAVDGKGRNSPYTTAFLKHIEEQSEIGDIFRDVSSDVYSATGKQQLPELSLSIIGKFYFKGPTSIAISPSPRPAPVDPCAAAGEHWKSAESIGTLAAFEDHLRRFPTCPFAGLAKARVDALKSKVAVVVPPAPPARPPRVEDIAPAAVTKPAQPVNPCGAPAVAVSLSSRAATPLTAVEECGVKPMDSFRECDKCPDMVMIGAGSFAMGANNAQQTPIAAPRHQVTVAKPFAVGRFHITVAQFTAFVAETGHQADSCMQGAGASWRNPGFAQSANSPVVCVSWHDASAYVAWLSKKTGKVYRLLTEAEWEYAARAGTTTEWFWGDEAKGADGKAHAHCVDCAGGGNIATTTTPVGSFKPNMFGLYDMAGDAGQLVQDCYHANYNGAPTDGSAWIGAGCLFRVIRGGSWAKTLHWARSSHRFLIGPDERTYEVGFRVARTLER